MIAGGRPGGGPCSGTVAVRRPARSAPLRPAPPRPECDLQFEPGVAVVQLVAEESVQLPQAAAHGLRVEVQLGRDGARVHVLLQQGEQGVRQQRPLTVAHRWTCLQRARDRRACLHSTVTRR